MRRSRVSIVVAVLVAAGGLAVWWTGAGLPGSGGFGGPRGSYAGSERVRAVLRATPDFDREDSFEVHYADHRALRAVGIVPGSRYGVFALGSPLHPSQLPAQTRYGNDPGFEFAELDSTLELYSDASWRSLSFLRGRFDRERLGSMLEARGSALPHALGTVWCGAFGCERGNVMNIRERGVISAMYGGDLGAQWPVALRDGVMIVTREFEVLEGALGAVAGRGTSLGERPEVAALRDGLDGGWEVRQLYVSLGAPAVGSYPDGAVALALADVASNTQEWGLLAVAFDTRAAADRFSADVGEYFTTGERAGTSWGSAISKLGGVLRVDAPLPRRGLFVVRVGLERPRGGGSEPSDVPPAELFGLLMEGFFRVGMPWVER